MSYSHFKGVCSNDLREIDETIELSFFSLPSELLIYFLGVEKKSCLGLRKSLALTFGELGSF